MALQALPQFQAPVAPDIHPPEIPDIGAILERNKMNRLNIEHQNAINAMMSQALTEAKQKQENENTMNAITISQQPGVLSTEISPEGVLTPGVTSAGAVAEGSPSALKATPIITLPNGQTFDPVAARRQQLMDVALKNQQAKDIANIAAQGRGLSLDTDANGNVVVVNKKTRTSEMVGAPGEQFTDVNASNTLKTAPKGLHYFQRIDPDTKEIHTILRDATGQEHDLGAKEIPGVTYQTDANGNIIALPSKVAPGAAIVGKEVQKGDISGNELTQPQPLKSEKATKIVNDLAKDVQDNKPYQQYRTIAENFRSLDDVLKTAQSNPADWTGLKSAAIDNFQRIINPNSVVRQQAFSQTAQGASLLNRIESFFGTLSKAETITPQQIESLRNLASQFKQGAKSEVQNEFNTIKKRGDAAGVNPQLYLPSLDEPSPSQPNAEALKWILDNPNDPRAPAVRKKLNL